MLLIFSATGILSAHVHSLLFHAWKTRKAVTSVSRLELNRRKRSTHGKHYCYASQKGMLKLLKNIQES